MNLLLYNILWIIVIYIMASFVLFAVYIIRSIRLTKYAKKFLRYSGSPIIAFFGDSTGYGVGASCPEKSLAGLVAQANPRSTIINDCKNGLYVKQLIKIINKRRVFDFLIICCGGIDILKLRKYSNFQKDIRELLAVASKKGDKVILITPINLGFSLAFPWFLRGFYRNRSRKIGLIIKKESKKFSNVFVLNNLLLEDTNTIKSWKAFSALDRIHPSDIGYAWVFKKLKAKIKIEGINF